MACHLRYFNIAGYFNSLGYVREMGINLSSGTIFGVNLNPGDKQRLEEAIATSDKDSSSGTLTGIIDLIQLVEQIQDLYGAQHDHKHPTEAIVKSLCEHEELISHYHLEEIARRLNPQYARKAAAHGKAGEDQKEKNGNKGDDKEKTTEKKPEKTEK